jgi:hypothetical protein
MNRADELPLDPDDLLRRRLLQIEFDQGNPQIDGCLGCLSIPEDEPSLILPAGPRLRKDLVQPVDIGRLITLN